jgi:hypothetical protein
MYSNIVQAVLILDTVSMYAHSVSIVSDSGYRYRYIHAAYNEANILLLYI